MEFTISQESHQCSGRLGEMTLPHGKVQTPAFMPVGTQGAVKTIGSEDLEALGYELILCNTYHLSLRPGENLVESLGGLHRFMSWDRPILTDSGGYQVMSLSKYRKITDDGVTFQSHLDGNTVHLTPERSIEIQRKLGVDISMALDVCPAYSATEKEVREAMDRTHAWAPRCLEAAGENQAVFGIVQGGVHPDFRAESAEVITGMPFAGFAVGGVSVGEPTDMQYPVVQTTAPLLPADRPRYLMGVGHPKDIIHAVKNGIDMFDCVLPTRTARHHGLYTMNGIVNVLNQKWEGHNGPVDPESVFPATARYSAAYMRHLFKAAEPLGARIATLHNLAFYARLMHDIRDALSKNAWPELEKKYENA
ncbi:MAG: tRNA guanosine(34) transglycosylase Tgt [Armatimonadetes bacterium]|nr:tRNA guanosine(34) transglycosylase Tgt [Armatimonadota bacterium]